MSPKRYEIQIPFWLVAYDTDNKIIYRVIQWGPCMVSEELLDELYEEVTWP